LNRRDQVSRLTSHACRLTPKTPEANCRQQLAGIWQAGIVYKH